MSSNSETNSEGFASRSAVLAAGAGAAVVGVGLLIASPARTTGLGLLWAAIGLWASGARPRRRTAAGSLILSVLGATCVSFGLASWLSSIAGIGHLVHPALHLHSWAGMGLLFVGAGVLALVRAGERSPASRWIPAALGTGVLFSGLWVHMALREHERLQIRSAVKLQAAGLGNEIHRAVRGRVESLTRLAERGREADIFPDRDPSCRGISWTSTEFRRSPLIVGRGDVLEIHVGSTAGTLRATFDIRSLLENIPFEDGCAFVVLDGEREVFGRGLADRRTEAEWGQECVVDVGGSRWRLRTWPRSQALAVARSALPMLALLATILLAGLLSLVAWLGGTARLRSAEIRDLYDGAPCGYVSLDPTGRILRINKTAADWLGLDASCRSFFGDFVHPRSKFSEDFRRLQKTGHARNLEYDLLCAKARLPVLVDAVAVTDASGQFLIGRATIFDATERRRVEEMRARIAALVESSDDAILGVSLDGRIQNWNPGAERMYGIGAEQALGRHVSLLVPRGSPDDWPTTLERLHRNERFHHFEILRARADGTILEVSRSASPVRDPAGRIVGASFIDRDVTEARKVQARVQLTGRLVALGTLASGVAHEINNPLAFVSANLGEIADGLRRAGSSELGERVREAREGAERIRRIVENLRMFARGDEDPRAPSDLRRVIETSIHLAWNEIRHRATLVRKYGEVPKVLASEARLGQVFLHLLVNAAHAIPEGQVNANEIRIETRTDASGRVIAEVRDTGCGMSPEILARLFDPFFSTRPVGSGTGLGLATCHGIVESLGGEVSVESSPGKGSVFRVALPAAPPEAAGVVASHPRRANGKRGKILIVDDEGLFCSAIRRTLARDHEVTATTDPTQALSQVERGDRFDLILCDLMMPTMTGMDLYSQIVECAPDQAARMIFMTGGAFTSRARTFLDQVTNPRLEKPFDMERLREFVREHL